MLLFTLMGDSSNGQVLILSTTKILEKTVPWRCYKRIKAFHSVFQCITTTSSCVSWPNHPMYTVKLSLMRFSQWVKVTVMKQPPYTGYQSFLQTFFTCGWMLHSKVREKGFDTPTKQQKFIKAVAPPCSWIGFIVVNKCCVNTIA